MLLRNNQIFFIADYALVLSFNDNLGDIIVPENYQNFMVYNPIKDKNALKFEVVSGPPPFQIKNITFHSELWNIYQEKEYVVYQLVFPTSKGYSLYLLHNIRDNNGIIYIGAPENQNLLFPLISPLDQLLLISLLAPMGGLLVHSCGLVKDGRALLFSGFSEAGKSTTARLWKDRPGIEILNDDRIFLRIKDGVIWAYGTPWSGSVPEKSAKGAPLDRIFFLHQGPDNQAVGIKPARAASRLLARAFPTYWDKACMNSILETVQTIVTSIPCYDYFFLPDQSAVDYIECL